MTRNPVVDLVLEMRRDGFRRSQIPWRELREHYHYCEEVVEMLSEEEIERVARCAHEVNRVYCRILGEPTPLAWDDAPEWMRRSVIDGARYHEKHMDATPELSHENWCQHKFAEGWRYGPFKDPDKKEHPCLVPYCELPLEQRRKDEFFVAVTRSLLS